MRENALKNLLSKDQPALNGWLCLPASFSAEVMAAQGRDALTIDLQHGLIDYQMATRFVLETRRKLSIRPIRNKRLCQKFC
jgi:4-hydroxy-2-oxoheptanedioate aldolase